MKKGYYVYSMLTLFCFPVVSSLSLVVPNSRTSKHRDRILPLDSIYSFPPLVYFHPQSVYLNETTWTTYLLWTNNIHSVTTLPTDFSLPVGLPNERKGLLPFWLSAFSIKLLRFSMCRFGLLCLHRNYIFVYEITDKPIYNEQCLSFTYVKALY